MAPTAFEYVFPAIQLKYICKVNSKADLIITDDLP
jgi:hypothetical protein